MNVCEGSYADQAEQLLRAGPGQSAIADVRRKKDPAAIGKLRVAALSEGSCAQILHVGPFSDEGPTIEKLHRYIDGRGTKTGKHHEIYLSDVRKADPKTWKTIIRQPMRS